MKISQILLTIAALFWAFICGYELGQGHQKVKYITKEIEIVKKITQKRALIHSRPHITRDTALELMRKGKL